jgi:hypothetical protein
MADFDEVISDVRRIMIRHDADGPSATGSSIAARFGVDNIVLVGDTGLLCDFDADGLCRGSDIDLLMSEVAVAANAARFDLNSDGAVNDLDRDRWLAAAGVENGLAGPYLVGDANLDGAADAQDLNALALTWQSDNALWTKGNFAGAQTNAADLNALALSWQQSVPAAANSIAVPEPRWSVAWLLVMLSRRSWQRVLPTNPQTRQPNDPNAKAEGSPAAMRFPKNAVRTIGLPKCPDPVGPNHRCRIVAVRATGW